MLGRAKVGFWLIRVIEAVIAVTVSCLVGGLRLPGIRMGLP